MTWELIVTGKMIVCGVAGAAGRRNGGRLVRRPAVGRRRAERLSAYHFGYKRALALGETSRASASFSSAQL
jgi:hypothetical protein